MFAGRLLCNIASSLVDQDRPADAIPHYKAAQKLAEEEGFVDSLTLTLGGEAVAHMALNRFARAHGRFLRLHQICRGTGQEEAAVIALHDAGICLMKQRKGEKARETLRQALAEAHEAGVAEWAYRYNNDIAFTYTEEGNPEHAIEALREAALAEQKDRRFGVAARLWESLATMLADQSAEPALIEDAFLQAISALEQEADSVDERLRLLSGLYEQTVRQPLSPYTTSVPNSNKPENRARQFPKKASAPRLTGPVNIGIIRPLEQNLRFRRAMTPQVRSSFLP